MSGVLCGAHWSFKRVVMSTDDRRSVYKRSAVSSGEHVRHGANSSVDPSIASTRASKDVSTNSRSQPKADLDHHPGNYYSSRQNSYHGNHQLSGEDGSRKRKHTAAEEHGEGKVEEVWTEHMSSKGRVYYYNQLTTKSQWTRPLTGIIKKAKESSSTESTPSRSSAGHSVKCSSSNRPSPREHTGAPSTHGSSSKAASSNTSTLRGSPITSHKSPWQQRGQHRKSSSSSATPDMASPTYRQRNVEVGRPGRTTTNEPGIAKQTSTDTLVNRQRSADGLVNRQKSTDVASKESQLPPQVQELHPLQQAFLLQTQFAQSSLLTGGLEGGRKDEVDAPDRDGIVSMETSPTDSNSAEIEGVVIPQADSGIYPLVVGTSHRDMDFTHTQLQQQTPTQEQLSSIATTPPVPSTDQPLSTVRSMQTLQPPSLLLAPNVVYNPIADLPAHLREPLPPTPPGSDCFAPCLAEFWLTPSHEMLEKQIHQSSHEFLFKTVSSTRRLSHLLAKADIQTGVSGLVSESRSLRIQSLKRASKDVGDAK